MNTRAFINEFGRDPKDYIEVKAWIRSIIEKEKKKAMQAKTYMTL